MYVPSKRQVRKHLQNKDNADSLEIYDMSSESDRKAVEEMLGRELSRRCVYVARFERQFRVFVEFYDRESLHPLAWPYHNGVLCLVLPNGLQEGDDFSCAWTLSEDPGDEARSCAAALEVLLGELKEKKILSELLSKEAGGDFLCESEEEDAEYPLCESEEEDAEYPLCESDEDAEYPLCESDEDAEYPLCESEEDAKYPLCESEEEDAKYPLCESEEEDAEYPLCESDEDAEYRPTLIDYCHLL